MIYSTHCCLWHLQLQLLSCGAVLASAMPLFNTVVLAMTLKDFLLTGASVTYSVSSTASIIYCANQIKREVEECVLKLHDVLLMLANHNQCQKNETVCTRSQNIIILSQQRNVSNTTICIS